MKKSIKTMHVGRKRGRYLSLDTPRFAPLEGMLLTYEDMGNCVKRDSIAHVISQKSVKVPSADVERIRQLASECLDGR